jgi:hypothetical protein
MDAAMNVTQDIAKESVVLRNEEEQLITQISELTIEQKRHYYALEVEQVKDLDTYAKLSWFFLIGLHHFYLGKWQRGSLNLLLILLSIVFFFSSMHIMFGGSLIILTIMIELPQLLNSKKIMYSYNNQIMKALLKQVTV